MKRSSNINKIAGMTVRGLLPAIAAGLVSLHTLEAISAPSGEQVFHTNCAVCHAGGGNILDPQKPVKGSTKLTSKNSFKTHLSKPVGSMPAFPQIVGDAPALEALYKYCKSLK